MEDPSKKWTVVYPLYLAKGVSVADGRRVSSLLAVEAPKTEEIATVCKVRQLVERASVARSPRPPV